MRFDTREFLRFKKYVRISRVETRPPRSVAGNASSVVLEARLERSIFRLTARCSDL